MNFATSFRRCCSPKSQTASYLRRCYLDSTTTHNLPARFLLPYLRNAPVAQVSCRHFTATLPYRKSGGKQNNKSNVEKAVQKTAGSDDPFDFSDYETAITKAHEYLKSEISKIKAGGRGVEGIEEIHVNLGKGKEKSKSDMVRVGDLASVVARGRNVIVIVGEKDV